MKRKKFGTVQLIELEKETTLQIANQIKKT